MAGCHWPVIIWLLIFAKSPVTIYNMRRREILPLPAETLEKQGKHHGGVLAQRVVAVTQTPVVHQSPLKDCVCFSYVVDGQFFSEETALLPLDGYLPQKFIISPAGFEEMTLSLGDEL